MLNGLRNLRKLGNLKKFPEMIRSDGEHPDGYPKAKF